MATIKIINHLELTKYGLGSKLLTKDNLVFLEQGSLDGACGPYCLFMSLLILGKISNDDTNNISKVHHKTSFGKSLKKMNELNVLIKDGTTKKSLKDIIETGYKNTLNSIELKSKGNRLIEQISKEIDSNNPVITSVFWDEGFGHWLLAVGYETDDKDLIKKIFFLDPSRNAPVDTYWNSVVLIGNGNSEFPHYWLLDSEKRKIKIKDCLSISPIV